MRRILCPGANWPVVFSGGGSLGPYLIGAHRCLIECDHELGPYLACSVGCFVVLMIKNGWSDDRIMQGLVDLFHPRADAIKSALAIPSHKHVSESRQALRYSPAGDKSKGASSARIRKLVAFADSSAGVFNLVPYIQTWIEQNELEARNEMYFYSWDVLNDQPLIWSFNENERDGFRSQARLALAMAASSAVPGLFRPVSTVDEDGTARLHIDGGFLHPAMGALFIKPAIVLSLFGAPVSWAYKPDPKDTVFYVGRPRFPLKPYLTMKEVRDAYAHGYAVVDKNSRKLETMEMFSSLARR